MSVPATLSTLVQLALVGEALHGSDWQRATARDLGRWHPAGPRDQIDPRLLRRWLAGERPVASWVADALPRMLTAGADARRRDVARLEAMAARLRYVRGEAA